MRPYLCQAWARAFHSSMKITFSYTFFYSFYKTAKMPGPIVNITDFNDRNERVIKIFIPDLEEVALPLDEYASLRDFFARSLKEGCRPIDPDPKCLVTGNIFLICLILVILRKS